MPPRPGTEIHADPRIPCSRSRPPVRPGTRSPHRGGLTESAPHRRDRRGADEEVQLFVSHSLAQIPAPQTFPAKTRSTSASSRLLSAVVPISPAAWMMPASGGSSACTVINRRCDVVRIGDIGSDDRNSQPYCSPIASMRCRAAAVGARRLISTTPGAVRGQVFRDLQPDGSEPRLPDTLRHCVVPVRSRSAVQPVDAAGVHRPLDHVVRLGLPEWPSHTVPPSADRSIATTRRWSLPARSASPPHSRGCSSEAARPNPTGTSDPVTRCPCR